MGPRQEPGAEPFAPEQLRALREEWEPKISAALKAWNEKVEAGGQPRPKRSKKKKKQPAPPTPPEPADGEEPVYWWQNL